MAPFFPLSSNTRDKSFSFYDLMMITLVCVMSLAGCAFPPPVDTTVSALRENPDAYRYERLEVTGTVTGRGRKGHPEFPYWHFHLTSDGADIICYSETYKHQVWSAIDLLIRDAAAEQKEIRVTGYLVSWGSQRKVLRATAITYEGHTYNAEFLPPAVSVGF